MTLFIIKHFLRKTFRFELKPSYITLCICLCKTEAHCLAVLREIDNDVRNQKEAKTEQWVLLAGVWEGS